MISKTLSALQMLSASLRALMYIIIVVNTSAFLYTMSTFVFSPSQVRMGELREQLKCWSARDYQVRMAEACREYDQYLEGSRTNPRDPPTAPDWQLTRTAYLLNKYTDEVIARNNYQIPIFGIAVDRNYFWLLNALWGSIQLLMILSISTRIRECLLSARGLPDVNSLDLRLMRATAILDLQPLGRPVELFGKLLVVAAMSLPFVVSVILWADDLYITDFFSGMEISKAIAGFLSDASRHPGFSLAAGVVETSAVAGLAWLTFLSYQALSKMVDSYDELPSFSPASQLPRGPFPWQRSSKATL